MAGDIVTGRRRFETLLRKDVISSVEYDRPLLAREDWLVAPTLGAIVPNWLLLIPRDPVLTFRAWSALRGQSPQQLLHDLRQHLGLSADEIIWFEHGPRTAGTLIGCGLDHAHIHILIRPGFSFEAFAERARSLSGLEWSKAGDSAYQRLPIGRSYLIAGSGDAAVVALDVETAGSQFFRRVVGTLADADNAWDYRQHPHMDHIGQSIRTFKSLESVARRDE